MNYKNVFVKIVGVTAMAAVLLPSIASAHGSEKGERSRTEMHNQLSTNEFGVRVFEDGNKGTNLPGMFSSLFYKGSVTAVSGSGFTLLTTNNATFTVTTSGAKIVRLPHTVVALSDIVIGDKVSIMGTVTGSVIDASVVFDLPINKKPAMAKGTVTAVSGGTVTVTTKDNKAVTVNTDSNTQVVKKDGTAGTVATDVTVGSKVKVSGLWDTVLHVLGALKIKLK